MFLHEAIAAVLRGAPGERAHRAEIARAIANSALYRTRRGGWPSPNQVSARVSKHSSLFRLFGHGVIGLR